MPTPTAAIEVQEEAPPVTYPNRALPAARTVAGQSTIQLPERNSSYGNPIRLSISNHPSNRSSSINADTVSLPSNPDFWDVLFSVRHSLTTNAFAVSLFMDLFNVAQLVVVICVLFIASEDSCDIPLRSFLYFYISRVSFSLILSLFFYANLRFIIVSSSTLRALDFLRLGIDVLTVAIVVCGNYMVFIKNDCQFSSPALFYTTFGLIVVNYLTIAFPIFLLITLLMSGRFRPAEHSPSQVESGAPLEAFKKTKLVRVRHNAPMISTTSPTPNMSVRESTSPATLSASGGGGPKSPTLSVFTSVSVNGTSILVVPPGAQDCSICLCSLEEDDLVRRLVCRHHFHSDCIDRWLLNHHTCPLCKHDLVASLDSSTPANTTNPRPIYLQPDSFLSLSPRIP